MCLIKSVTDEKGDASQRVLPSGTSKGGPVTTGERGCEIVRPPDLDHIKSNSACPGRSAAALFVHHSIKWSARSSNDWGMVKRSAFAVFRLITNSNFVGCSTGRSPGFAPLRILST